MKKLLIIAVVASATLFSCNKDWTCTCTATSVGNADNVTTVSILNTTKEIASSNCMGSEDPDGQWKTTCEIKGK